MLGATDTMNPSCHLRTDGPIWISATSARVELEVDDRASNVRTAHILERLNFRL